MALVHLVAGVHAAAVVLMLTGALLALRRPALLAVHAPVAGAILAVYLAGADCPLTRLELALRTRAGVEAYSGGFLGHYLFAPLGVDGSTPAAQTALLAAAVLPNLVGYGVLAARGRRWHRHRRTTLIEGALVPR